MSDEYSLFSTYLYTMTKMSFEGKIPKTDNDGFYYILHSPNKLDRASVYICQLY